MLEILVTEIRDITLSRQRTTKALIRLRGCAGWSVPLLFAYDIRHVFSWPGSLWFPTISLHSNFTSTVYLVTYNYRHCFPAVNPSSTAPYPNPTQWGIQWWNKSPRALLLDSLQLPFPLLTTCCHAVSSSSAVHLSPTPQNNSPRVPQLGSLQSNSLSISTVYLETCH